ncbi:MAG: DNA alkylation repair protein [Mariniphaga sp.]|nr:DNA alkylation repair protein [Mariniphaga sp.]MDD4226487.1 DNA alkylation repair protein [Mariniphaga sp.]MDD4424475.1 DNA alkylation repair protein [Mariniphaga sp.]
MEFLLDNPETEHDYQQLLRQIRLRMNGDVSSSMDRQGMKYKQNWGVSVVELRELAGQYKTSHLLAMKLWNKQWRETMILATLLDNPAEVTESQMDFWTKSFETPEISEQASTNLWVKTRFAFIKALEWCRGKKHWVRYTGIHLAGRLAISCKEAIDEMFEPFFEELVVLGKDPRLNAVIYRTVIALGSRSGMLNRKAVELTCIYRQCDQNEIRKLGELLFEELTESTV